MSTYWDNFHFKISFRNNDLRYREKWNFPRNHFHTESKLSREQCENVEPISGTMTTHICQIFGRWMGAGRNIWSGELTIIQESQGIRNEEIHRRRQAVGMNENSIYRCECDTLWLRIRALFFQHCYRISAHFIMFRETEYATEMK